MNSNRFRLTAALLLGATGLLLTAVAASENRATTCDHEDGNVHRLDCRHGVISVIDSVWGRSNSWVCTDEGQSHLELANTACLQESTVDELKTKCNGRKSCEVSLTGFHTHGTCDGTFKYLQTTFTCLEPTGLGHVTIDGAAYGRRDQTTCSEGRPFDQRQNVNCLEPSTSLVVKMYSSTIFFSQMHSSTIFLFVSPSLKLSPFSSFKGVRGNPPVQSQPAMQCSPTHVKAPTSTWRFPTCANLLRLITRMSSKQFCHLVWLPFERIIQRLSPLLNLVSARRILVSRDDSTFQFPGLRPAQGHSFNNKDSHHNANICCLCCFSSCIRTTYLIYDNKMLVCQSI
uniref:L-rhamnose-binding lectin CSL2-like n=1 Tax=Hippocampus comes TaxID=109280 RepID=A0A3Q3E446_HIPCM